MSFIKDFKAFALKGNVVDLAVGVIIGGAFGKIVSALVEDVVMPLVGLILPNGNWRAHGWILREAADPKDNVVLRWGNFLGTVVDFLIVSISIFFIISKVIQGVQKRIVDKPAHENAPPSTKACPFCFETIPIQATRCKACTSQLA